MSEHSRTALTARWAAVFIGLMMIAVPASAAIITQNFMRSDVNAAAACFHKLPGGDDALTADLNVDTVSNTISTASGVTLLQELVTITGYRGDRVTYTDVVRYRNDCDYDVSLTLRVENDAAGNPDVDGTWTGIDLGIFAANKAPALITTPVGDPTDWSTPIDVDAGTVVSGTTSAVTIPAAGGELQAAFVIDTDIDPLVSTGTGTLRFTAEATKS